MAIEYAEMAKPAGASMSNSAPKVDFWEGLLELCEPRSRPDLPPITINPERMGGTPTIAGVRLPVATLLDFLLDSPSLKEFVEEYGGITVGDCQAALLYLREAVEQLEIGERVDD
jgi:uncharacterized protein (DUF433 family)